MVVLRQPEQNHHQTEVPLFFWNAGKLLAETLRNPGMRAALGLAKRIAAAGNERRPNFLPSLDLFSDGNASAGADVSVQFRPDERGLSQSRRFCRSEQEQRARAASATRKKRRIVIRAPLLARGERTSCGLVDAREHAVRVSPRFSLVTVDPPFSCPEQAKLYARVCETEGQDLARSLMLDGDGDAGTGVERLYMESVGFAARHATEAILVLGYKAPRLDGWTILCMFAQAAGSGHPAVLGVLYVPKDKLEAARQILERWRKGDGDGQGARVENGGAHASWTVNIDHAEDGAPPPAAAENNEEREAGDDADRLLFDWLAGRRPSRTLLARRRKRSRAAASSSSPSSSFSAGEDDSSGGSLLRFRLAARADSFRRWREKLDDEKKGSGVGGGLVPTRHPSFLSLAQRTIADGLVTSGRSALICQGSPALHKTACGGQPAFDAARFFRVRPVRLFEAPGIPWSDVTFEVEATPFSATKATVTAETTKRRRTNAGAPFCG